MLRDKGFCRSACHQFGLVQTRVTLGGVKPSANWTERLALRAVAAGIARPYIEKSVTLDPSDLNQAINSAPLLMVHPCSARRRVCYSIFLEMHATHEPGFWNR